MKKKRESKLKEYIHLAEPKWIYVFWQMLTQFIHVALKAMDTVFAAKITVCLTKGDFKGAFIYLMIEFGFVIARNLFTWLNYVAYMPAYDTVFNNVQRKVIHKVMSANQSNFAKTSQEKIINIVGNNVETLATFSDLVTNKLSKLVQVIISFVIVAQANIYVALGLMGLCTINFFILKVINKKLALAKKKQYEAKDSMFEEAKKIMTGKEIINEFGVGNQYDEEYLKTCKQFTIAHRKKDYVEGFKNSWFYVIYYGMCVILTSLMIFLVSKGNSGVDLQLYLIVVPYFLTISELMNNFFEITGTIEDNNVAMARVNTILNFTDEELHKFGQISDKFGGTNISFVGVNYQNGNINSPYVGKLTDVDISFCTKSINLVVGEKRCGKRLIFNMLRRKIGPDSGVIAIDNVNISSYNKKSFHQSINYCVSSPIFITGSIMENLLVSGKNKNQIMELCKQLDIDDDILALPNGYDTPISNSLTRGLLFLIGMTRALLTDCGTLMIYEIPNSLTKRDKERILTAIKNISETKTVIFFTHTHEYDSIAKTIYSISEGKVVDLKINPSKKIDTTILLENSNVIDKNENSNS